MLIKAGTMLTIEQGEYSDKSYSGPFVVLKDIDQDEADRAFHAQWKPAEEWEEHPDPDEFLAWLARERYIEDVESFRWHIGSYGTLNTDYDR